MELKLEAKNQFQTIVLEHLKQVVSEELAKKINNGKKTLDGCYKYIVGEAKKRQENQCTVMTDEEVFGLSIHYFEEDEIEEDKTAPEPAAIIKTSESAKPKAEAKKEVPKKEELQPQLSLFDLL